MKCELTQPCDGCPFRNDRKYYPLAMERLVRMVSAEFCCHKPSGCAVAGQQHCAGALIFMRNIGKYHPQMCVAEQAGLYDPTKLNMNSPIFKTPAAASVPAEHDK